MGLGVLFSALAVLIYQGLITLTAVFLKNFLVAETISQMSSVGGLLIMAIEAEYVENNRYPGRKSDPGDFSSVALFCPAPGARLSEKFLIDW